MMCATLLDPNQPNQCIRASPVRAREHQIRAHEKGILGVLRRGSYPTRVTVYPYDGHIRGTNPVVRHVMSLACTLQWIRANWHAPKHATTQLLHYSNMRARAPDLVASYIMRSHSSQQYGQGAPSRVMLLVTGTTDILVQM